jgi:predicted DNA-binding transcriptional regulator YafY
MIWIILIVIGLVAVYAYRNLDRRYPVQEHLLVIQSAIRNGNDLRMEYFTYKTRSFRTRTVRPIELGEGGTYLRAYDHFRVSERTFKASRIKEIREVPRARRKKSE